MSYGQGGSNNHFAVSNFGYKIVLNGRHYERC